MQPPGRTGGQNACPKADVRSRPAVRLAASRFRWQESGLALSCLRILRSSTFAGRRGVLRDPVERGKPTSRKEFFNRIGHLRTVDGGPAATSNLFHLEIRWRPSGLPAIRSPRRSLRPAEADTLTGVTDRQGLMLRGLRTSAECNRTTTFPR